MNPAATTKSISTTLRALARLLAYPDATLRAHLFELRDALHDEGVIDAARQRELDAFVEHLTRAPALDVEAEYVATFDRGRSTSLHLFEHVHGDSRDRGPAMVDLVQTYEQAGLLLGPDELPDHLGVVLEYASTQPGPQARAFLGEIVHILQALFTALERHASGYASVVAAVIELAGGRAAAVAIADEPSIDAAWSEPEAFGGCSTAGQSAASHAGRNPGEQAVRVVRRTAPTAPPAVSRSGVRA